LQYNLSKKAIQFQSAAMLNIAAYDLVKVEVGKGMGVSCDFVSRTNCKIQTSHSLLATLKNVYTWIHDSGMCFGSVSIRLFQSKVDFALLPLPSPPKEGLILSCFLIAFRAQHTEFCPILMKIIKPLLPSSNMVWNTF